MSYRLDIPSLDGDHGLHVTAESFPDGVADALDAFVAGWTDQGQVTATRRVVEVAALTVIDLVDEGVVGDTFRVAIHGHANPTPGAPEGDWTNDRLVIELTAVKVPIAPPALDALVAAIHAIPVGALTPAQQTALDNAVAGLTTAHADLQADAQEAVSATPASPPPPAPGP